MFWKRREEWAQRAKALLLERTIEDKCGECSHYKYSPANEFAGEHHFCFKAFEMGYDVHPATVGRDIKECKHWDE